MVPDLEDLTYEEIKEIRLTTLKERRKRGYSITIHKLMNNLEEMDRKNMIMERKKRLGIWGDIRKNCKKGIYLNDTKKCSFPQRSLDIGMGWSKRW